jgi:hypothetical protein
MDIFCKRKKVMNEKNENNIKDHLFFQVDDYSMQVHPLINKKSFSNVMIL